MLWLRGALSDDDAHLCDDMGLVVESPRYQVPDAVIPRPPVPPSRLRRPTAGLGGAGVRVWQTRCEGRESHRTGHLCTLHRRYNHFRYNHSFLRSPISRQRPIQLHPLPVPLATLTSRKEEGVWMCGGAEV